MGSPVELRLFVPRSYGKSHSGLGIITPEADVYPLAIAKVKAKTPVAADVDCPSVVVMV